MDVQTKETQLVEVPIDFVSQVESFVNLLESGEIKSLSDLMQKAGFSEPVSFTKSDLTSEQRSVLEKLQSFTNSQDKFFRVSGFAGTGKTYLICRFIQWLSSEKINFVAACPTNKAAKNLKALAQSQSLSLDVKTVAQLLGQQPVLNEDTGKEEFLIKDGEADLSNYHIVIIDEFSMVNRDSFDKIVDAVRSSILTKVIFVGDSAQLPPVNETEPIVATSPIIDEDATLTQVVRYDGQLAHVAAEIRCNKKYSRVVYPFQTSSDSTIRCLSRSDWLNGAIQLFQSQEFKLNSDHVRILAWRNKTVNSLNHYIRLNLWGDNAPPYVEGDLLIARKLLFRPKSGGKGKNKWRILINNSEEVKVVDSAELKELSFQKQIYRYWHVPVQLESGGKSHLLSIIHENFYQQHLNAVRNFAQNKQWKSYWDLSRMFDDVAPAYALTTHKAQGSTINHVFLDVGDMRGCSDRQKLQYTALTRAKLGSVVNLWSKVIF